MATKPKSGYSSPLDELDPQVVLRDWIKAIKEFHHWHSQVEQRLNEPDPLGHFCNGVVFDHCHHSSILALRQLQRDITLLLVDLKTELAPPDDPLDVVAQFRQLSQHTNLLIHWTKQMQRALGLDSPASA